MNGKIKFVGSWGRYSQNEKLFIVNLQKILSHYEYNQDISESELFNYIRVKLQILIDSHSEPDMGKMIDELRKTFRDENYNSLGIYSRLKSILHRLLS